MNDYIDDALNVGAGFDWITPALSLVGGAMGRLVGVTMPVDELFYAETILQNAGISIHNCMIVGNDALFDVATDDATMAAALLGLEYTP